MRRLTRTIGMVMFGFVAGVIATWFLLGPRANASEGTVAFARNVEAVSDSVITLELLERSGCDAVRRHHEDRLRASVSSAGRLLDEIPAIRIDDLPSAKNAFDQAREWSSGHGLDEVGEKTRQLIDDMIRK